MKLKLVFFVYFNPIGLLTIKENIQNLQQHSKHKIYIYNLFPDLESHDEIDLKDFDGIIIHNTLSYFPDTVYKIEKKLNLNLKNYPGLKVLMKQDEHIRSSQTADMIGEKRIDLVLTCLSQNEINKVYPVEKVGEAKFVNHLTGYITDSLINQKKITEYNRCIDISYRGSIQPLQCGRLGFEKWKIGEEVNSSLQNQRLNLDISSDWQRRIYGSDWLKFLQCSKATLGVESGSNLFDLSSDVEKKCNAFEKANQALLDDPEIYYKKAEKEFLAQYEDNVNYAQISPRHFEAAATHTLQILYEGNYSNILIADRHYLPLKRDLSNLDEILSVVTNAKLRKEITTCAFEEIILNEKFHITSFINQFDDELEAVAKSKSIKTNRANQKINVKNNILVLVPHEIHLDPRIRWLEKGFDENANVFCIGVTHQEDPIRYSFDPDRPNHIHANLVYIDFSAGVYSAEDIQQEFFIVRQKLHQFLDKEKICFPENSIFTQKDIDRHIWYCEFFLKIDKALQTTVFKLIQESQVMPDCIVCCDLASLLPAVTVAEHYDIPLIYDAHEFWAYSDVRYTPWETDFWLSIEHSLLQYVDIPVTVSDGLAQKMSNYYAKNFITVANTELKKDHINPRQCDENEFIPHDLKLKNQVIFLYQGAFAKGRGFEKLILSWKKVDEKCLLILRGPENEYTNELKEYTEKCGLLNQSVFFLPPVKENELVCAAMEADVGIIPYDPNTNVLYQYCCPNKLSQYMAASLPIISNKLEDVAKIIHQAQCGYTEDFDCEQDLVQRINLLAESKELRHKLGSNALHFFLESYHWENQSYLMYTKIKELISAQGNYIQSKTMLLEPLLNNNNLKGSNENLDLQQNIHHQSKIEHAVEETPQKDFLLLKAIFHPLIFIYSHQQWMQMLYRRVIPYKMRQSVKNYLNIP